HFESTEQLKTFAWGFSVTAAVVGVYAIVQKITGWGIPNLYWRVADTRRVTAFFGYPNAVALYVELVMPFFVGMFFIVKEWWSRAWFVFVLLVSTLAIIFTQSSGAAAALVGTAWIFFVARKQTRVWALATAVIFTIALVLSPYKQKFADEFLLQGFSGQIRTHMWHETIEMLKPRWFVGAGLAGYETRVAPYHELKHVEIYLYPHNLVLTLWSEVGVLGLISFAWIFGLIFVWMIRVTKQKKSEPRIWAGTIIAVLCIIFIHGLVDIPYFKNDFSVLFWILVAMALQVRYT
ncbi:MAG: O-antigen ligase family protein, partial [Candidatus Magasanikbacteria bacterium]|nr:O-antigen ligase family protein [Candidatus Magasanikbacteria bacterium]